MKEEQKIDFEGNIVLVGMQCSGKTTYGEALQKVVLPYHFFFDTDSYFKVHGSINGFIQEKEEEGKIYQPDDPKAYAWDAFRRKEHANLKTIYDQIQVPYILASGGGLPVNKQRPDLAEKNVEILQKMGKVLYITPDDDVHVAAKILASRYDMQNTSSSMRPNQGYEEDTYERMLTMLEERDKTYRSIADLTIAGTSIDSVITGLERLVKK